MVINRSDGIVYCLEGPKVEDDVDGGDKLAFCSLGSDLEVERSDDGNVVPMSFIHRC